MDNQPSLERIQDIQVTISVELGRVKLSIRELLKLVQGSILSLDKMVGEPLDFYVNNKLFGACEIVQVNDKLGMRIIEIYSKEKTAKTQ